MRARSTVGVAMLCVGVGLPRADAQCSTRPQGLRGDEKAKPVFSLAISVPQSQVKQGTALVVTVSYANVSDHLIVLGTLPLDSFASVECFEIVDAGGNKVASRMLRDSKGSQPEDAEISSIRGRFMRPGDEHKSSIDLAKYYRIEQPGTYGIQFFRWSPEGSIWVGSNRISIRIE